MSESFFISDTLKNRVTRESLSREDSIFSHIFIDDRKYNVISVENNVSTYYIKIKIETSESFKIKNNFLIESGNIFGNYVTNIKSDFLKISYNPNQKKYICEILIDEEKFWSYK